jgi:uracil-DNA glycosylase
MSRQFLDEKMFSVALSREDAFEDFRDAARGLIGADASPSDVTWRVRDGDLLGGKAPPESSVLFSVPAAYVQLAETVVCHRDPERFALLYELLWRITHDERELLSVASDPLMHRLQRMQKSVYRDMHKMMAFLRFRRVDADDGEHFVARFEPEHFILRRMSDFFIGRFAAMR